MFYNFTLKHENYIFIIMISLFTETSYPVYTIDFKEFLPKDEPSEPLNQKQKILIAVSVPFGLLKLFFTCLAQATYLTLSYSGTSFKHIVLGYYGNLRDFRPPGNFYLIVFRVGFWIAAMGFGILAGTYRTFVQKSEKRSDFSIKAFVGEELDIRHLRTNERSLDTSQVPSSVKVDDLVTMFDAINFDKPGAPGYMPPSSRREGNKTYSIGDLRKNLKNQFVQRIKTREAFFGTPPWHDTPRLMAFYQQIEDALRISIHKVQGDVAAYIEKNPDPESYEGEVLKGYKNLLEDRARLVLDLAIAGVACGARYMSETMDAHGRLMEDNADSQETLEGAFVELLASKRKEIALKKIAEMGNDAHAFSKYMQNMGEVVAIPGTKNIIEHLSTDLDLDLHLKEFFEEYTVDFIIEKIQEKIQGKKSQKFKELIIDWIKDQVKDWKKEEYMERLKTIELEIQDIQGKQETSSSKTKGYIDNFREFIKKIEEENHEELVSLLKLVEKKEGRGLEEPTLENFIENFFELESVKKLTILKYPPLERSKYSKLNETQFKLENKREYSNNINNNKNICKHPYVAADLYNEIKKQVKDWKKAQYAQRAEYIFKQIQSVSKEEKMPFKDIEENVPKFMEFILEIDKTNHEELVDLLKPMRKEGEKLEEYTLDEFIDKFFASQAMQDLMRSKYGSLEEDDYAKKIQDIKDSCKHPLVATDLLHAIKQLVSEIPSVQSDKIDDMILKIEKIIAIKKIVNISEETLIRALDGKAELLEVIQNHLDQERKGEFLIALNLIQGFEEEKYSEDVSFEEQVKSVRMEISPAIMEWLLVSQKILLPQITVQEA